MNGGSVQPHWMVDGNSFWYVGGPPDNTLIWRVDPRANTRSPFFDMIRLRRQLTRLAGYEPPEQGLPFREFQFLDAREQDVQFRVGQRAFTLNLESYRLEAAEPPEQSSFQPESSGTTAEALVVSPDLAWYAGTRDHNVVLQSARGGPEVALTTDGTEEVPWGPRDPWQPAVVWSPDESRLAVERLDFQGVPKIPMVRYLESTERVEWVHYSRPHEPKPRSELFIVDVQTKRRVRINLGGEPNRYIRLLDWRIDGSAFLFLRHGRYYPGKGSSVFRSTKP